MKKLLNTIIGWLNGPESMTALTLEDTLKILVISDTHERTEQLEKILERHADEVQVVCHLGDNAGDLSKYESRFPQLKMIMVAGNCDYSYPDDEHILEFTPCADSGAEVVKRVLLIHGHRHDVKISFDRLAYYAKEKNVDACFFGHTHLPEMFERGDILMLNPGSLSCPLNGQPSYAIVEISPDGEITGRIVRYEKN